MKQNGKVSRANACYLDCSLKAPLVCFPDDWEVCKLWFEELLVENIPSKRAEVPTNKLYLCINHFSSGQFKGRHKNITSNSVPDKNIPGKDVYDVRTSNTDVEVTKQSLKKVITSKSSLCLLKCKDYTNLYRFPKDGPSHKIWLEKLGIQDEFSWKKSRCLCNNHFSKIMRPSKNILAWAVPDMNLPSQSEYVDEFNNDETEMIIPDEISCNGFVDASENEDDPLDPGNMKKKEAKKDRPIGHQDESLKTKCILKCTKFKKLHNFPASEHRRTLWLSKIGLPFCSNSSRICNRHFSENMFEFNQLIKGSFPNINLPKINHQIPVMIYREYTSNKKVPKRERCVQTQNVENTVPTASIGVLADEDFGCDDEDLETFDQQQPSLTPIRKGLFECLKCGEITLDSISSQKHSYLHEDSHVLCFHCGRLFSNRLTLKNHERNEHLVKTKRLHRCPQKLCKKVFRSQKKLVNHLEEHTIRTKYKCNNCGRVFFSTLKLQRHLLSCRPRYKRTNMKKISKKNKYICL